MIISLIVAYSSNKVIGKDNDLVWSLPDDMKYFSDITRGHHVIMGRRNWDSIPLKYRPLRNRTNIILTRNTDFEPQDADTYVFNNLDTSIEFARQRGEKELFIIGGAQIYQASMDHVQKMYITEIEGTPEGDTFFPDWDGNDWKETSRKHHPADERHEYSFDFVVYERIN